jgi:hypothetical protein
VLRRYSVIKKSSGTTIPARLRGQVKAADGGCVGYLVGMEGGCSGAIELDHVRASGGMGMKSATERGNLVSLCGKHHLERTLNGRKYRPLLLEYIAARDRAC